MNSTFLLSTIAAVNGVLRKILAAFCALLMAALTGVVLWGVFTRYIFGEQPAYTEEFARMFLICVTFFGGALAFADASHIGLDFLASRFSESGRKLCALISVSASLFFACGVLIFGGIIFIKTSMDSSNMMVSAPVYLWQIYLCIPISGAFSFMFLTESFLLTLFGKSKFEPAKNSDEGGQL